MELLRRRAEIVLVAVGIVCSVASVRTGPERTIQEYVRQATHVVVGVTESAPLPSCDLKDSLWWRPVLVERYLKGQGPPHIIVNSSQGDCLYLGGTNGPKAQFIMNDGGVAGIPPPGIKVLLILKGVPGSNRYRPDFVWRLDSQRNPEALVREVEEWCNRRGTESNPPLNPTGAAQPAALGFAKTDGNEG
jgi:hypothetical protein